MIQGPSFLRRKKRAAYSASPTRLDSPKPQSGTNGYYVAASIPCFVVALTGVVALLEHWDQQFGPRRGHLGREWLANIFPFGLALSPVSLLVVTFIALVAAFLLLRAAKTR